jgi:hypothetical protein
MNDYRMLGLGDKTYLFQPTRTGKAEIRVDDRSGDRVVAVLCRRTRGRDAPARRGRDVAVDGTSFPYRQAVCVASLFYGLLGCWFAFRPTARCALGPWPPRGRRRDGAGRSCSGTS